MNLIYISQDTLINPQEISYVHQKKSKNGVITTVCVDGKEFELEIPLRDFFERVGINEQSSGGQYWRG